MSERPFSSRSARRSAERVQYYVPPGVDQVKLERFHLSQAVRAGNMLEVAGQSGADHEGRYSDDVAAQVSQALDNVGNVLTHANAGWADVVSITTYHVNERPTDTSMDPAVLDQIARFLRTRLPDHPPVWTAVAVASLAHRGMRIEISVRAWL